MLLLILIWLAFLDSINPTSISVAIFLCFYNGVVASSFYTSGVFVTTWIQGILFYLGAQTLLPHIPSWRNIPYANWILSIIGIAVILYGLSFWKKKYQPPSKSKLQLSSDAKYTNFMKYIILGIGITTVELPSAFFLIIAAAKVQQVGVNNITALLYFFVYAVIYVLPMIGLIAAYAWQTERIKSWLSGRFNSIYIKLNIVLSFTMVALGIFILTIGVCLSFR
jgi:cytochrome c biogenesis protein CcdA